MRVLHVVSFYEHDIARGGVAKAAGLLARLQRRLGLTVTVFATDSTLNANHLEAAKASKSDGVSVRLFPVRRRSRLFFSWPLLKACLDCVNDFDIVHIHGVWVFPGTCGAFAARREGVPYVVSPHGMLNLWATQFGAYKKLSYWYAVERHTIRGAAWIHFVTEEEKRQAQAWVGDRKSKVIPIGLDIHEFSVLPPGGGFRDSHNISRGVPLLAFLGRIHPIKGLDVLLRAMIRVKAEVPDVMLAIAGPDEDGYGDRLREIAERLGLQGHVRWVGIMDGRAKHAFLVDADLFVLPSFSENFGLAAVEAMAVGSPIVIGRGVNIAPQVEAYGAGWVVPTEAEALSSAIIAGLRDRDARQAAGKAGRRLVAEWCDGETMAREMLKGYEECLR